MSKRYLVISILIITISMIFLVGSVLEVFQYTQGSGNFFAGFSFKKGVAFLGFAITSVVVFTAILYGVWKYDKTLHAAEVLINWRIRTGRIRWILAALILILPIFILQYTIAGSVLNGFFSRMLVFLSMSVAIAILINQDNSKFITSSSLASSILIISAAFSLSAAFNNVISYPFSLSWSEGNRIWDYSVLFGRQRYNYPVDQSIFAFIDKGRQSLWGLPFLVPGISIIHIRLWNALVITVPYAILGWIVFHRTTENKFLWLLSGIWVFVFLIQGPIYTPLILSAILVAIAWRSSVWIAIPLILVSGFYAKWTRFTWMFAPALWAGILYLGDKLSEGKNAIRKYWWSAFAVVLMGLIGSLFVPRLIDFFYPTASPLVEDSTVPNNLDIATTELISMDRIIEIITRQPLILSRLLPNPTYGPGIVLALLLVTLPLTFFLIYLVRSNKWILTIVQRIAILVPMIIFLIVGLVVSTKIGGGGDLHNMDMFLIGLVFVVALAWKAGADQVLLNLDTQPWLIQAVIIIMMFLLAIKPVSEIFPQNLPPAKDVANALETIREQVSLANQNGEVLFLDQRQLLTFGYVENVPLVPEYEKKYLMDQAMSGDTEYFKKFYEDLSQQRFTLIISEPLKIVYQGSDHHFGLENDTWVKWVSEPILCYYEPSFTFKPQRTQLLVPRDDISNCKW